jgi:gas vesicle protein
MTEKIDSKISYFLVIGILFAPKSGEDTRAYLSRKVNEGSEYAQKKAQHLRVRTEDLVERGKEVVGQEKRKIAAAEHEGRETYQREKDTRYLSERGWR